MDFLGVDQFLKGFARLKRSRHIQVMLPLALLLCGRLHIAVLSRRQDSSDKAYVGPYPLEGSDDVYTVHIGGLFPIHESNKAELAKSGSSRHCSEELSLSAFQRLLAMPFAIEEINAQKMIGGVKLAYEMRDTCQSKAFTLFQTARMISARQKGACSANATNSRRIVSAVVGAAASGPSIEAASLLRLFKVPQISYASTSAALSDPERYGYFVRTVPPDNFQARAIISLTRALNASFISLLHSKGAYGTDGARELREELQELRAYKGTRLCLGADMAIGSKTENEEETKTSYADALRLLNSPVAINATIITLFSGLKDAREFLLALAETTGFREKRPRCVTWIGSDAWGSHKSLTDERLLGITRGMLGVVPKTKEVERFHEYFLNLNPEDPATARNPWLAEFWRQEFDCDLEKNSMCAKNRLYQGHGKQFPYKQDLKVAFVIDAIYTIAGALRQLQKQLCSQKRGLCAEMLTQTLNSRQGAVDGKKLLEALKEQKLVSEAGHLITFTSNGDLATAVYEIRNLQVTESGGRYVTVGSWERLSDEERIPLGVSISKDGELVSVECYDVKDQLKDSNCTRVRLRLNLTAIQWCDGSSGISGIPQSRCSEDCPAGHTAKPRGFPYSKDVEGCCWQCVKCEKDWYTTSQLEACRECPADMVAHRSQTMCIKLALNYWSLTGQGGIVAAICLGLSSLGLLLTVIILVIAVLAFPAVRQRTALQPFFTFICLTGIGISFCSVLVSLQKPNRAICLVQFVIGGATLGSTLVTLATRFVYDAVRPSPSVKSDNNKEVTANRTGPQSVKKMVDGVRPRTRVITSVSSFINVPEYLHDALPSPESVTPNMLLVIVLAFYCVMITLFHVAAGAPNIRHYIIPHQKNEIGCEWNSLVITLNVWCLLMVGVIVASRFYALNKSVQLHSTHNWTALCMVLLIIVGLPYPIIAVIGIGSIVIETAVYSLFMVLANVSMLILLWFDLKVALIPSNGTETHTDILAAGSAATLSTVFESTCAHEDAAPPGWGWRSQFKELLDDILGWSRFKRTMQSDSLFNSNVRKEVCESIMPLLPTLLWSKRKLSKKEDEFLSASTDSLELPEQQEKRLFPSVGVPTSPRLSIKSAGGQENTIPRGHHKEQSISARCHAAEILKMTRCRKKTASYSPPSSVFSDETNGYSSTGGEACVLSRVKDELLMYPQMSPSHHQPQMQTGERAWWSNMMRSWHDYMNPNYKHQIHEWECSPKDRRSHMVVLPAERPPPSQLGVQSCFATDLDSVFAMEAPDVTQETKFNLNRDRSFRECSDDFSVDVVQQSQPEKPLYQESQV